MNTNLWQKIRKGILHTEEGDKHTIKTREK
jgi:hypothetical protein